MKKKSGVIGVSILGLGIVLGGFWFYFALFTDSSDPARVGGATLVGEKKIQDIFKNPRVAGAVAGFFGRDPGFKVNSRDLDEITSLSLANYGLSNKDLQGMEYLNQLQDLNLVNNALTNLDVSSSRNLQSLHGSRNQLIHVELGQLDGLKTLNLDQNQLTHLEITDLAALKWLNCAYNQLSSLEVSNLRALEILDCAGNLIPQLDLSGCTLLSMLWTQGETATELQGIDPQILTLYAYTQPENRLRYAVYRDRSHTLTAKCVGKGVAQVVDVQNNTVIIQVKPDPGAHFVGWAEVKGLNPIVFSSESNMYTTTKSLPQQDSNNLSFTGVFSS